MENQILRAILFYRMKNEEWIEVLRQVLNKAQYYHFARIFAKEGIALKPLLDEYQGKKLTGKELPVEQTFFDKIVELTNERAVYFPKYLEVQKVLKVPLTKTEDKVLKLMCKGLTKEQICDLCCFSESSFKQHRWSIFKKLDVKNRGQAEKEAVRLEINE